ncbi:MAG: putative domain RNA-binding protein [Chthoniobacteraceae bacterium]|nr:putative domain RNA-binding protein [Chthoniobacteraceae bacterium]
MHQAAMQEFLDYVLRQLIDFPEEMVLTKTEADEKRAVFKVRLRQSDVGKVIGKHGHTIIAIRNLLAAAASRHGEKAILDIVEEHAAS